MLSNADVIEKDGAMYGFYGDIIEYIKNEIKNEIDAANFSVLEGPYSEIVEALEPLKDSDNIIKISDNNGMGWTARELVEK